MKLFIDVLKSILFCKQIIYTVHHYRSTC